MYEMTEVRVASVGGRIRGQHATPLCSKIELSHMHVQRVRIFLACEKRAGVAHIRDGLFWFLELDLFSRY